MLFEAFSIGPVTVHGYGLMIGIGVVLAFIMATIRAKRRGLKDSYLVDMAIIAVVGGFAGGKLLYIIAEYKDFFSDPLGALTSEGFVVYGGIILAALLVLLYCKKIRKTSFFAYFDLLMPSVALGQAFGRIGCLCAGCCYGRETTSAIGIVFPHGCMAPAGVPLMPTQIMMAVGDLIICLVLILFAEKAKIRGYVGALYLVLYGIGRFVIEFFRDDYRGDVGPFSTSQFISLFIVVIAIIVFVYCKNKNMAAFHVKKKDINKETN